jgi:amino acid transporter
MLIALISIWAALLAAQGTPLGNRLHRLLVEAPARRLSGIGRGHVLLAIVTLSIIVTLVWFLENDGRMLVTMGLPEFLGFATAVDLSALLDLAAVAVIAATTIRVRTVAAWLKHKIAPRRARARRTRVQRQRPPANDDERRPALAA